MGLAIAGGLESGIVIYSDIMRMNMNCKQRLDIKLRSLGVRVVPAGLAIRYSSSSFAMSKERRWSRSLGLGIVPASIVIKDASASVGGKQRLI